MRKRLLYYKLQRESQTELLLSLISANHDRKSTVLICNIGNWRFCEKCVARVYGLNLRWFRGLKNQWLKKPRMRRRTEKIEGPAGELM
jgi:hypothetical protein